MARIAARWSGPALEEYIGRRLEYPPGFPYTLAPPAALIREVRTVKVAALARADPPAVRVEAVVKAWLWERTRPHSGQRR